jgi:hypothetical protein
MYQKLADRLKLYEQNHPIKDDDGLMAAIEDILNEQDSLPIEERDFDLIAEATDSILKLQGYRESDRATMAEEAANSVKARIASHQKGITANGKPQNKHRSVLRWIIPLVAILTLTTAVALASPTSRLAISDMTKRVFSTIKPQTVYHEDNIDLITSEETIVYSSFSELSEAYGNSILLPFSLENDCLNMSIESILFGQSDKIIISFIYNTFQCSITVNHPQQPSSTSDNNVKESESDIVRSDCETYMLAEWEFNGDSYQVKSNDKSTLELVIERMR